jgi:hypothetical protein
MAAEAISDGHRLPVMLCHMFTVRPHVPAM